MQYYQTVRNYLVSGPHGIDDPKAALPAGAVVTDEIPTEPGEGEAVIHAGHGRWALASPETPPGPAEPVPPRKPIFTHYQFATDVLTADQNDAWLALVETARAAVADGTASPSQRAQHRAYTHFNLAGAVDMNAAETQAGIMAMYIWGVFGPVHDTGSGEPPTPEEQRAIDEADRVAAGLRPDEPAA